MNDFTKEELEYIFDSICFNELEHYMPDDIPIYAKNLMSKIQSIIDDYPKCDHRSGINHYNEKGESVGYESDIYRCKYCSILFRFKFENGQCVGHEELE